MSDWIEIKLLSGRSIRLYFRVVDASDRPTTTLGEQANNERLALDIQVLGTDTEVNFQKNHVNYYGHSPYITDSITKVNFTGGSVIDSEFENARGHFS